MGRPIKIKVGSFVHHDGDRYVVVELSSLEQVLCRSLATKSTSTFPIESLTLDREQKVLPDAVQAEHDLGSIPDADWEVASKYHGLIRELADKGRYHRTHVDIEAAAKAAEKSPQTIYRWLHRYEADEDIKGFLRKQRTDKNGGRLAAEVEAEIQNVIKALLLKREHGTIKDVHRDVKRNCIAKGFKPPGMSAVRDRFLQISEYERLASQKGKKVAKEKLTPLRGSFPGADQPLDVIQIDHTPADVIIVDEVYRKPIGRLTLTIAIDVCTRMLMGFNMWLEAPSAASVGLCLHHAMLPKEKWLEARGIKASWPCYGRPRKIHTDNAKEFRGTVLGRACQGYGINLEQRPKGSPNFGGHVERGFRTFMRKTHTLPGTTFSNTRSKFDYDSSGKALMTMKEFEYWFTIYIAKIYHNDYHSGARSTPLALFKEGVLGINGKPGIGLPERFLDEKGLRLDFLPFLERTVQEYGVVIDYIHYNADILRPRIHQMDPSNPRSARKFIFRRDPDDVSVIYFWDPDTKKYSDIPYAHLGRPPASLWEVRAAIRDQIARGKAAVDENMIFEGIDEMREIEKKAAIDTKGARRNEQRRRDAERRKKKAATDTPAQQSAKPPTGVPAATPRAAEPSDSDEDDELITAFDDIDMRK